MIRPEEAYLRARIGDMNTHCGFTEFVYADGPARGLRAFALNNGRDRLGYCQIKFATLDSVYHVTLPVYPVI